MKRFICIFIISIISFLPQVFAAANPKSIAGTWQTYDNEGNARSIVKFYSVGDEWRGKILKVTPVEGKESSTCSNCSGENKDKPLVGMDIVTGLKAGPEGWTGGTVIDTDSGNTYSCSTTLSEDGKTMHFYAHLGPFGKTIDWKRVEAEADVQ